MQSTGYALWRAGSENQEQGIWLQITRFPTIAVGCSVDKLFAGAGEA